MISPSMRASPDEASVRKVIVHSIMHAIQFTRALDGTIILIVSAISILGHLDVISYISLK